GAGGWQGPGFGGEQQEGRQNAHRVAINRTRPSGQGRGQGPRLARAAGVARARRTHGGQFRSRGDQVGLKSGLGGGGEKHGAAQVVAGGHVARIAHGQDQAA